VARQALQMCNAFIAYDSFLMHLSAAMDVPTIGLFVNKNFLTTSDNVHLVKIATTWDKKCDCPRDYCSLLDDANSDIPNCFYSFDTADIAKQARALAYGN
jgi:ADP-heptose:LPS heptosyltransferase